jgi:hypothetical protein
MWTDEKLLEVKMNLAKLLSYIQLKQNGYLPYEYIYDILEKAEV